MESICFKGRNLSHWIISLEISDVRTSFDMFTPKNKVPSLPLSNLVECTTFFFCVMLKVINNQ